MDRKAIGSPGYKDPAKALLELEGVARAIEIGTGYEHVSPIILSSCQYF